MHANLPVSLYNREESNLHAGEVNTRCHEIMKANDVLHRYTENIHRHWLKPAG